MNLLSLDIGLTTGYAVFEIKDGGYKDLLTGDADQHALEERLLWLKNAYGENLSVIAEKPLVTRGQLSERLDKLVKIVEASFWVVNYAAPSEWKPTPVAKTPLPRGLNQHQKDAVHLGMWYCQHRLHLKSAA